MSRNSPVTVFGIPLDDYFDWVAHHSADRTVTPIGECHIATRYAGAQVLKVVYALRTRDGSAPAPEHGTVARSAPPSFDEWFKAKHGGVSFDAVYWQAGMMLSDHVHALSREARAYISEIAQGNHHG